MRILRAFMLVVSANQKSGSNTMVYVAGIFQFAQQNNYLFVYCYVLNQHP